MNEESFIEKIERMKRDDLKSSLEQSLVVTNPTRLLPVGPWILSDVATVQAMSSWRWENRDSFFSRFPQSEESTLNYLRSFSIGEPNRLLFLVSLESIIIGHLGVSNLVDQHAEIDSVLKSSRWPDKECVPSMGDCLKILMDWANHSLGIEQFSLKLVSSNNKALALYERLGFEVSKSVPVVSDPRCSWGSLVDAPDLVVNKSSIQRLTMNLSYANKPW